MSENIECWANGEALNRKLALERVVRVLKSFGREKKDIDFAALQKTIDDLPYSTTIYNNIAHTMKRPRTVKRPR